MSTVNHTGSRHGQSYEALLAKIDAFTRKYYLNKIVRGAIYFAAICLAAFIAAAVLEYFGHFSSGVRTFLFFTLCLSFVALFGLYILIPALKLIRLGRSISHEEASRIIGAHFPEVSDKLLNTLQLREQAQGSSGDSSLLMASIDQKIAELEPVPFAAAVKITDNRRYLVYLVPPVLLAAVLLLLAPHVLTESTRRIVTFEREYVPEAPFSFVVANTVMEVPQNENFSLVVHTEGSYIPGEIYLSSGDQSYRMQRQEGNTFTYNFRNVRKDTRFFLKADGYRSADYLLEVLAVPALVGLEVELVYPSYLNMDAETTANTGNLQVPEGTRIAWKFATKNSSGLYLSFDDTTAILSASAANIFTWQRRVYQNEPYYLAAINPEVGMADTLAYRIEVIKDAYPRIAVEERSDSARTRLRYFGGQVSDDHGLSKLEFHYSVQRSGKELVQESKALPLGNTDAQPFYYQFDIEALRLQAGDVVQYYFEVWDNDGVNGAKASRSEVNVYEAPTEKEIEEAQQKRADEISRKLEESIAQAAELQKEFKALEKDLLSKPEMGWQEKKRLEDLLKQQQSLSQNIADIERERKASMNMQKEYQQQSQEILQKQEQLEKLFDELMSEEMKELYRKLQELMEQMNKEQILKELQKIDMSNEELEKELDRTLEIFKQMEFEQNYEQALRKLEKLAKEQRALSEETKNKEADNSSLQQQQDSLNRAFEELSKEMDTLEKQNQELERPNDIAKTDKQQEQTKEEMQGASEQLEQKQEKKAAEKQQNAAEQMEQMAQQMQAAMSGSQAQQQSEDMDALRALLENIIQLSFDQEEIMENLKVLDRDDPRYVSWGQAQKKLEEDSRMVEDSLFALSKRVVQIAPIVNEEIGKINMHIGDALDDIGERMTANAAANQQYVMTSYNNLALLLDEALQQMQMAMANNMPGKGNCEKPGGMGKNPNEGKMSKLQESMGKKLEQMLEQMQKGQNPGQNKPGMGMPGMSKEIAQMAAEQAAIRREIERLSQELNKGGKGQGNGLKEIAEEMEQIEKDLVNQDLSQQTLMRQRDIMTRLLESEKAEREREYDEKRESKSPENSPVSNPEKYFEYNRKRLREIELLRTVPPDLKPYYKERVNDYFLNFEN